MSFTRLPFQVLLQQLKAANIRLALDELGGLRVRSQGDIPDDLLAELKANKEALVAWLKGLPADVPKSLSLTDKQLLSSQQLRVWSACQYSEQAQQAYWLPTALLIEGNLSLEKLNKAIQRLLEKHPTLSLEIFEEKGQVWQQYNKKPFVLALQDVPVAVNSKEELNSFCQQRLSKITAQDLSDKSPLWHIELFKLADKNQHLLIFAIHHLMSDGVSNHLLMRDLLVALDQDLPPTSHHYLDYVAWQKQQDFSIAESFWQQALKDCEPISLSYKTSKVADFKQLDFVIDGSEINALCQSLAISRFSFFYGVWAFLLAKLSGQNQLAIVTPDANRRRSEWQDVIGFFANTLFLPVQIQTNSSLADNLRLFHQQLQQVQAHADYPFEQLLSHHPEKSALMDVAIHYVEQEPSNVWRVDTLSVQRLEIETTADKFPLSLNIQDGKEVLLQFAYDANRYEPEFIALLVQYYQHVVQRIINNKEQQFAQLSLFTEYQRACLLGIEHTVRAGSPCVIFSNIAAANNTQQALPSDNILTLISQQVKATPQAIAVSDQDQQLTYQALWQQSGVWAHAILDTAGSGKHIGISLSRSVHLSVVLLGILRSGNAYLPLDIETPKQRLQFQIQDSRTPLVIAELSQKAIFEQLDCAVIYRENAQQTSFENMDDQLVYQENNQLPQQELTQDYIENAHFNLIYTSGSTGVPKGVSVLHAGIANRLQWMQAHYAINAQDTVLQKTPITFDVSVWELFLPLMAGARLHFAPPESHKDALALQQIIQQENIQVLHFVPSMLRLFLEVPELLKEQHQPRLVFCSGEVLSTNLVRQAQQYWPQTQWHNLYGPTEASVDVSYFDCAELPADFAGQTAPIGKPISNTQLHILDENLQPVSPFCVGEIVTGGANLASGYWNKPELTATQFIDNPYFLDGHPSAKLYKTGDTGRFLADGNIEYLGRKDSQVKLRGLRIELGDIEAQASKIPTILEAAALIVEQQEQQFLVLFYRAEQTLEAKELRKALQEQLPSSWLPNYFLHCMEMPLTSSGKRDTKALKAMFFAQQHVSEASQDLSAIEQAVLAIWQQHLSLGTIQLDDDFFVLGGHSLLAGKIVAQLAEQFDCDLRLADFLNASTVKAMAAMIKSKVVASSQQKNSPVLPERIPATTQQKRLFLYEQLRTEWNIGSAYHMPLALQLSGELNIQALEQAIQASIKKHRILRTVYQLSGEEIYLIPSEKSWQLEIIESQQSVEQLLEQFNRVPFDLSQDLPLRACLVKQVEQRYVLLVVLHHIAGDARSLEVLAQEWLADYQQFCQAESQTAIQPEASSNTADYYHYAHWQAQQDFSDSVSYWQQQLADAPERLSLPKQLESSDTKASSLHFLLPESLSQEISVFCQIQGITPFVFLLSVYQLLLGKLARMDDVAIALAVSGRHQQAWQDTIGFFVNTVVIRSRQEKNPSFTQFLQQQKQTVQEALQHQDVALEDVIAALGRRRNESTTPIVQAGFNYLEGQDFLNNFDTQWSIGDLIIEPVSTVSTSSKTALNWIIYPNAKQQFELLIEYETASHSAQQLTNWFQQFSELLKQALAYSENPIAALNFFSEQGTHQLLKLSERQQFLPATAMQQAIILDSLLYPDKPKNRIGFYSQYQADVASDVWRQSLAFLYQHNDLLRSHIRFIEEVPYVVIEPQAELPEHHFQVFEHDTNMDIQQAVDRCLNSPWDLKADLWRVHLHLLPNQQQLFIAAFHHSVFDGVSIQLLGRLMKGNVEKLLQGKELIAPSNDYKAVSQQLLLTTNKSSSWSFWAEQKPEQVAQFTDAPLYNQQFSYLFNSEEEQQLKALCRQFRVTPALYFKALFALAAKYTQGVQGDYLFYEVVTGRNKNFLDTIGLLFDQQPNILSAKACQASSTINDVMHWFKVHRKEVSANTPISLNWQKKLFPQNTPFIFNFYIMETASTFMGREEHIRHIIPQIDGAVNLVCQEVNGKTELHLYNRDTVINGDAFWQLLRALHQHITGAYLTEKKSPPESSQQTTPAFALQDASSLKELFSLVSRSLPSSSANNQLIDIYNNSCPNFVIGILPNINNKTYFDGERLHKAVVEDEKISMANEVIKPSTELEQQLLTIWQEVLGKQNISIHDDFFELGGHSLSAMRIALRLQERHGIQLPLATVFEQPTIAAIAEAIAQQGKHEANLPPIAKAVTREQWSLSSAQKRLMLLSQIQGEDSSYNIAAALQIKGQLNEQALQQALQQLLARHSVLRSRFTLDSWWIDERRVLTYKKTQLQENQVISYCQEQANKPFKLLSESPVRVELIQLSSQQHVLLWQMHHIISDAKSLMVLAQELLFYYQAANHQTNAELPALALDYQDYCVWQENLNQQEAIQKQLSYWQQELHDAPLLLGLPIDEPRKNQLAMPAGFHHFSLPDELTQQLQQFAKEQGISLFMLLLAAYQLLLTKRCQQSDICIGIPREGRPSSALENTVGFFVNALVIRNRYAANQSIDECLQAVKCKVLKAFDNEQVPAETVIQALNLPRDLSYMPIVQAAFNYLDVSDLAANKSLQLDDLSFDLLELPAQFAKFECLLTVSKQAESLQASFEYHSGLFHAETIASLAQQYQFILQQLVDENIKTIDQIQLSQIVLTDEDQGLSTPQMLSSDFAFYQLSSAYSPNPGDKAAIVYGKKQLSYQELEQQSNQLAHYLLAQGVRNNDRIGLCFSLEPRFFIALYAVVKAGACYVPLDNNQPSARLEKMIADASLSYLLCSPNEQEHLDELQPKNLLVVQKDYYKNYAATQPKVELSANDIQYLIYTSGSTGTPKAVAVYRHNFAHLLHWFISEYHFNADDKTLLITSPSFDLSQKNFFALLHVGGTLVLPETTHYDAAHYRQLIEEHAVTTINCAPSAFYPLLEIDSGNFNALRSLKTVLLGGEPINSKALKSWCESLHFNAQLVNMYGPSECTDIATAKNIQPETILAEKTIPFGAPIDGVTLCLVDEYHQAVPQGLIGELCITGAGLGAGYWQNPELTQQQFIQLFDKPYYKTGDLARINPQGELIYIGRKDNQIKHHGVRIELAEIVAQLNGLLDIQRSEVLYENSELIAFVQLANKADVDNLKPQLANKLPAIMLPKHILAIEQWPLNNSGKVDRAALLALSKQLIPQQVKQEPERARNVTEEKLITLWQEVLGKPVGIHDNFFAVGGDSIAAVRVIHQIELSFAVDLPVASLFHAQTIAQLAQLIEQQSKPWSPIVPLQAQSARSENTTPIFALHGIGGMVFHYQAMLKNLPENQAIYGIQAYGFEQEQTPFDELPALVNYYVQAIKQTQAKGPYRLIGHSFGGLLAFELARELIQQGDEVSQLVLIDTHMPIKYLEDFVSETRLLQAIAEQSLGIKVPQALLKGLNLQQAAKVLEDRSQGKIHADFIQRSLAVSQGFKQMTQGYQVQPLDIPITLIRPEQSIKSLSKKLMNKALRQNHETLGWEKVTSRLTVEVVEGDHFSILKL